MSAAAAALAAFAVPNAQDSAAGDRIGHPTFMSPHASPIAVRGGYVFVANTPSDTVDVIDAASRAVVARIDVGVDPVGLAVRPDGKEVWVANHVSDSVSVIDTDPESPTWLQVVATVQHFNPGPRVTIFDEPVGVAFADNDKAYVALSSENQVAVIDVAAREVTGRLSITAQDPRAIVVRDGLLFVIPFESNNQTQISGCRGQVDGNLCTFDAQEHVVDNNNVLSLGIDVDIVKNPKVPDRDLYVFETTNDTLINVATTVGTLLYGLAVDSTGRVFVAQADARNDANGRAGTRKHGLAELENRPFLNRITRIDCAGGSCGVPEYIELEPLPPEHPEPGTALATPFAIQVSDDDSTLVVSAAGSDVLFTVDAESGAVLGRGAVGEVPRGIALESDSDGAPARAWVLNAVANTVSLVEVSEPADPSVVETIPLEDPTHPAVKRGRIAFHAAGASTTGTFSCESCHPDGHTDQLVWVLDTPICDIDGCTQIPPRSTMPVRGLRDTAPFHWDGIPGDPFGGNNTANVRGDVAPNCRSVEPESCTRFLVDATLGSTMCMVGDCPVNDEGKDGALSGAERDDLATFLLSVPYPPPQRRAYDNVLSRLAVEGFRDFHIEGVPDGDSRGPNVCGDCHRMPFWVSTNTPGTGMDAPTWRGAYDRWLILPQGRWNVIDLRGRHDRDNGFPERSMWGANIPERRLFWNMVTEGSTGFSGSFARQVTLDAASVHASLTADLLDALELSAAEGGIVLQGEGVFIDGETVTPVALEFEDGVYVKRDEEESASFSRTELSALAADGGFVGTFSGRLGANVDVEHPQPALWAVGSMHLQRGRQAFPRLSPLDDTIVVSGRHVQQGAHVIVDGRRVSGSVRCQRGQLPACSAERLVVQLQAGPGMHLLQLQNPDGLFSNDFIFFGRPAAGSQAGLQPAGGTQDLPVVSGSPLPAGPRRRHGAADVVAASDGTRFRVETMVTGLEAPASLAVAPDGRLFLTERPGRVRMVRDGRLAPEPALELAGAGSGVGAGLLGLALDPEFSNNRLVYLLQTRNRPGGLPAASIVRYRELGDTLAEAVVLLDDLPAGAFHGSGRLGFGPDGSLYAALGDAGNTDAAQDLGSYSGKMLRVRRDGTTPRDNPLASPLYSWGHLDPGGFDWHPLTGALWAAEKGPPARGEVNQIEAGGNYGWPIVEGFETLPGLLPPALLLSPFVAPGGVSFHEGTALARRPDLFVATLDGAHLLRVRFDPADPGRIAGTERLIEGRFGRLTDVASGPGGALYVATGNRDGHGAPAPGDDRIIRLTPLR